MNKFNEIKIGGLLLMIGTLIFLITVYFEYTIGWISASGGPEDKIDYVRSNWPALSKIWNWQMIGSIFSLLAYLLFFKNAKGVKSFLWAIIALSSLLSCIAFFLTLGSYGPALEVYDTSPEVFDTIRGGIYALYQNFLIAPFVFMLIFGLESFDKYGIVAKKLGIVTFGIFIGLLAIGLATSISVKISGLPFFLLHLVLGYSAIKFKNKATVIDK